MTALHVDNRMTDDERRRRIYAGDLFVHSACDASIELCELARRLLVEAFGGRDPRTAQHDHEVADYARILARVKPVFIHHPECKRLLPKLLETVGCDPEQTHFDVPRLRSATSDDYLTTGIAYAFHPHRDTWYSAPMCQINWWMPVYDVEPGNAMAFHPAYFGRPVRNDSWVYDYGEWNARYRYDAARQIGTDTRRQPRPLDDVPTEPSLVVVTPPGGVLLFSAAHLHSTVPNRTGRTRFSIDFRTVHAGDAAALAGAVNVDAYCTGSAIGDYLRASDLRKLPAAIQDRYAAGHPQPPLVPPGGD